ncbi:uncharacterized protein VTP21DRAFT_135 [Calcarisporiella thermophila]|uniref:uncharacterized protein n=1 Tax=Calcarisporiella thermophila TaxID=911321 RepID=UPI0037420FC5
MSTSTSTLSHSEHRSLRPKSCIWKTSHVIPNTGSTCRDHLANERTFLSWLRVSVLLMLVGISMISHVHFGTLHITFSRSTQGALPMGSVLCGLGCLALLTSVLFYFRIQYLYVNKRGFVEHGQWSFLLAFLIGLAITAATILAIVMH